MRVGEIMGVCPSRSLWPPLLPSVRNRRANNHVLIQVGRQHAWIWTLLVFVVLMRSYFVRELLSALLLFTIFFVILASLVSVFVLMGHVLYCSFVWAEPVARSFQSFLRHSVASAA